MVRCDLSPWRHSDGAIGCATSSRWRCMCHNRIQCSARHVASVKKLGLRRRHFGLLSRRPRTNGQQWKVLAFVASRGVCSHGAKWPHELAGDPWLTRAGYMHSPRPRQRLQGGSQRGTSNKTAAQQFVGRNRVFPKRICRRSKASWAMGLRADRAKGWRQVWCGAGVLRLLCVKCLDLIFSLQMLSHRTFQLWIFLFCGTRRKQYFNHHWISSSMFLYTYRLFRS